MSGVLRTSLTKIVPAMRTNVTQKASVVSGPPKNPMSMGEKMGVGGAMCFVIIAPMMYIMANVKHYRGTPSA